MVEVKICIGSSCHLKGSYNLINMIQQMIEEYALHEQVDISASFCMKHCQQGVSVTVDGEHYSVTPETVRQFFHNTVLAKLPKRPKTEKF